MQSYAWSLIPAEVKEAFELVYVIMKPHTLLVIIVEFEIMKNKIGLLIAMLLLGYGIVRVGVGAVLYAQALEIVNVPRFAEANLEVKEFVDARASEQIVPFRLNGYLAYIFGMGILLSMGAIYTIIRRKSGFVLLWIYIGMHAILFVNFLEINPKLVILALQVILLFVLRYLRPPLLLSQNTTDLNAPFV